MAFKFKDFIEEGQRREKKSGSNRKPFEIELADGEIVTIEFPDANTYMTLAEVGEGSPYQQLRALFRKNPRGFQKVIEELEGTPVQTIASLVDTMWEFWEEDLNSTPGKSKA